MRLFDSNEKIRRFPSKMFFFNDRFFFFLIFFSFAATFFSFQRKKNGSKNPWRKETETLSRIYIFRWSGISLFDSNVACEGWDEPQKHELIVTGFMMPAH